MTTTTTRPRRRRPMTRNEAARSGLNAARGLVVAILAVVTVAGIVVAYAVTHRDSVVFAAVSLAAIIVGVLTVALLIAGPVLARRERR